MCGGLWQRSQLGCAKVPLHRPPDPGLHSPPAASCVTKTERSARRKAPQNSQRAVGGTAWLGEQSLRPQQGAQSQLPKPSLPALLPLCLPARPEAQGKKICSAGREARTHPLFR